MAALTGICLMLFTMHIQAFEVVDRGMMMMYQKGRLEIYRNQPDVKIAVRCSKFVEIVFLDDGDKTTSSSSYQHKNNNYRLNITSMKECWTYASDYNCQIVSSDQKNQNKIVKCCLSYKPDVCKNNTKDEVTEKKIVHMERKRTYYRKILEITYINITFVLVELNTNSNDSSHITEDYGTLIRTSEYHNRGFFVNMDTIIYTEPMMSADICSKEQEMYDVDAIYYPGGKLGQDFIFVDRTNKSLWFIDGSKKIVYNVLEKGISCKTFDTSPFMFFKDNAIFKYSRYSIPVDYYIAMTK